MCSIKSPHGDYAADPMLPTSSPPHHKVNRCTANKPGGTNATTSVEKTKRRLEQGAPCDQDVGDGQETSANLL